jgi:lactate permease
LRRSDDHRDSRRDVWLAYAPYVIIIAVLSLAQVPPIKDALDGLTKEIDWPGLNVLNAKGEEPAPSVFKLNWAITPGTLLLVSGLLTMLVLRISPARALRIYGKTLNQLKWATLTVATVLALAYVMNFSAQTLTLGQWIAGAGGVLAFLSAIIGWLGVAVTGSDTSSNALFGALQVQAAKEAGLDPTLLAAANSSGGVLGKMISPQNLAIGAAAVAMAGQEGELFRTVLKWSIVLVLLMCVLVLLQSTAILSWMVV